MPAHLDAEEENIYPELAAKNDSIPRSNLAEAFLAGFLASGEGFNGEYALGGNLRNPNSKELWEKLRPYYIEWLEGRR